MAFACLALPPGYSGAGTTTTTNATQATTAGSTLGCWVSWASATTITTVDDVAGNTYTAFGAGNLDTTSGIFSRLYLKQNAAGHAANAITVTRAANSECTFIAFEVTDAATSSLDSTAQASARVTHNGTENSQSVTTADQADEVVVSCAFDVIGIDSNLHPTGASFTHLTDQIDAGAYNSGIAYRIVSATGAYDAKWDTDLDFTLSIATVGIKKIAAAGGNVNLFSGKFDGLFLGKL